MNLGNMKVGPKLFLGFGVVLVLTVALGIVAFMSIGNMEDQSELMEKAADLKTEMKTVRQQEKNYIMRQDQASIDSTNDAVAKVKSLSTELEPMVQTAEGRAAVADVQKEIPTYESAFTELQALTKSKDDDLAACEEHARAVESAIKGSSADQATQDALVIELLTIRRTEKNYVAREDDTYVTQVSDGINSLKAKADAAAITVADKSAIKGTADEYQEHFSIYVSTTKDFSKIQDTDGPLVESGRGIDAAATALLADAHEESAKAASTATMFVMAFILAAIAVGVGIALVVTKSIVGPVTEVVRVMKDFAVGKLGTRAKTKASGELLEMTTTMNQFGDDLQGLVKDVGKVSGDMAEGDLTAEFTAEMPGEFNAIKDSLNGVIESIKGLLGEAGMLAEAAVEGKLETRGDVSKYKGGYAELVQGVNETLDAVIGPLNVAAEYVDRISKGDIPEEITDEYKGDFNEIKNNLNMCIKAVNGLVDEAGMLAKAAVEGKLETRGDTSKFGGDFAKIVQGVNDTLDGVIGPLNVAAEYVDRISKGDIPEEITDEYKGDFNEIKNNLNQAIQAINGLTAEAGMLAEAAVEGRLETRGDASKFGGDFAKIVQGVNETLDGVIGPLNVAAEYVDRISKGDIPEEITDEYKGDFNEIKNNLNDAIKAINGLVAEAGMLAEAAVEGKLDTRGDASKFGGDFAKIVQGVNETLDGVIGPLNVAAEYVDRISKGDIPEEITDEYKGDFNEIKNNLNEAIKAINGLTAEAGMLNEAAVEGKLETRGDASKFGGDFAKIVQGVNETLDAVIGPLQVAADYVDKISKGDIPEEITDEYKGDFNTIKNNLNEAIKAVNGLVAEAGMLAEAAVEGKLETRGDAAKFGGDFAKIVQGVNDTLDAVIEPIHAVTRMCDAFAEGNLSERIKIDAKGEFLELTETLNNFGENLRNIVTDIAIVTGEMAAGNLSTEFTAETPGDFNVIRDNLNQATDNLSDLITELRGAIDNVASIGKESASSVEQVNSGMQQISSASQQIAKGAQETSSTVNESAKEVKETNAVLQQVQSNAEESNKFAVESAESAKEMNEMAMKSSEGMKEIQDAINDTVAIIKNLNSSLEQVGKTTEVIEGIAEQTNLLALNAAIEAARAGEHGRGFAVVAEEVRKLAENSKKSTGDIDTMIKSLQEEMEKVIKATETVTQRAEVGREDLEKAVAGVEKTAGMIDDIKNRMEQITEGAKKGAESIEKVSKGVDEIASSSEQAASSSEESSSAVEEQTAAVEQLSSGIQKLSEISEQATQMIAKFKLKGGGEGKKQE